MAGQPSPATVHAKHPGVDVRLDPHQEGAPGGDDLLEVVQRRVAAVGQEQHTLESLRPGKEVTLALLVGRQLDLHCLVLQHALKRVQLHGRGPVLREATSEDFRQTIVHCKRASVLNDDVGEVPQVLPEGRPQHLLGQIPEDALVNLAHEDRKLTLSEPVVERLVAHREPVLCVEGAQDVGDRPDAIGAQGFHQGAHEPLGRDGPQPPAVTRRTTNCHEGAAAEHVTKSVGESGNIGSVQR